MRRWLGGTPLYVKHHEEIAMLYGHNLSYREIQKCLGVSSSTITKALRYAERTGLYAGDHIRTTKKMALADFGVEVRQYLIECWDGDTHSRYRRRPSVQQYGDNEVARKIDNEFADAEFVACLRQYHPERETGIKKADPTAIPDSSLWRNGLTPHYEGSLCGSPSASCLDE